MVFRWPCFSFEHEATTQTKSTTKLRVFTVSELKAATRNFTRSSYIGKGGFGSVYKGVIKSLEHPFHDIQVAVKHGKEVGQEIKDWLAEVNTYGVVEHPNLVKLVGYCLEEGEREMQLFLVYEYMHYGSVKDHLSTTSKSPLSWAMRLRVAQDTARAFAYLHEQMEFEVTFRNFNASNVLLDDQGNAKLSNFLVTRLEYREDEHKDLGTTEYEDPDYIIISVPSESESDVWSYGAFLYELITGTHPMDSNRSRNEQRLRESATSYLPAAKKLLRIIDPRIEGRRPPKSAGEFFIIANLCMRENLRLRPKMSEVLEMVNKICNVPPPVSVIDINCTENVRVSPS